MLSMAKMYQADSISLTLFSIIISSHAFTCITSTEILQGFAVDYRMKLKDCVDSIIGKTRYLVFPNIMFIGRRLRGTHRWVATSVQQMAEIVAKRKKR